MPRITRLDHILMCLMARVPRTGNELVALLREFPLGGHGQSPGAVYPALHRLHQAGLTVARPRVRRQAMSIPRQISRAKSRAFREYTLSSKGLRHLKGWSTTPVTRTDFLERPDYLLLRFAFLPGLAGRESTVEFLEEYEEIAKSLHDESRESLEDTAAYASPSGRLATQLTVALFEVRAAWAREGVRRLKSVSNWNMNRMAPTRARPCIETRRSRK